MKAKFLFLFLLLSLSTTYFLQNHFSNSPPSQLVEKNDGAKELQDAFNKKLSNIQVKGSGIVESILPDDNKGSKHQRFILKLSTGQTILIAHNIDLAPRLPNINKGDTVAFFGEYEWNEKGGVVHWTHKDPQKKHIDGWLKFREEIYW